MASSVLPDLIGRWRSLARRLRRAAEVVALTSLSAAAQDLQLDLPLDCTLGETCFIQQYVDMDPGPGAEDFTGGPLSYDGHRGTDFRVRDLEVLADGVPVLAPAPGRVRAIRDEMPDRLIEDRSEVAGRECGNGVAIDHGNGWETQLCHLQLGSIQVAAGDVVGRGDVLGRMGLSGATQFPHVHITVRRDGDVVDPFVADLWTTPPDYEPGGLLSVGLLDRVPEFDEIKAGTADASTLPTDPDAIVIWGAVFGGQAGDVMEMVILGTDGGVVFESDVTLDRTQAQLFRAAGRRLRDRTLPTGDYTGRVILRRAGEELDRLETTIPIR
ncbi:MAG: M23 family metallopeptidase [Pseudomonadota bacterium]